MLLQGQYTGVVVTNTNSVCVGSTAATLPDLCPGCGHCQHPGPAHQGAPLLGRRVVLTATAFTLTLPPDTLTCWHGHNYKQPFVEVKFCSAPWAS